MQISRKLLKVGQRWAGSFTRKDFANSIGEIISFEEDGGNNVLVKVVAFVGEPSGTIGKTDVFYFCSEQWKLLPGQESPNEI